jgi:hypothetical protein
MLLVVGCHADPRPQLVRQCKLAATRANPKATDFEVGQYAQTCMLAKGYTWSAASTKCEAKVDLASLSRDVNLDPTCYVRSDCYVFCENPKHLGIF